MAKRRAKSGAKKTKGGRKSAATRRSAKRPSKGTKKLKTARKAGASKPARAQAPRLNRARRTFEEIVATPPSSLNMDRHGSAVRTGRAELAESRQAHASMTPAITGGDVDANVEAAYFGGDEAPGGDNPTPDQDIVDDIGKAIGIEYQDNEELKASDKIVERDTHRWELDPASSEDYKDRK